MSQPEIVTVSLDTRTLLIAAATTAAACQEILDGNAEIDERLRESSAEAFARAADEIITTVSEAIAKSAHEAANGTGWTGDPQDRPWRREFESERGQSLALLAQRAPRAVELIRAFDRSSAHG